jgi:HK97 family phage major capsid protein
MWIELLKDYLGKKTGERLSLTDPDAAPLIQAGIAKAVSDDPLAPIIAKGVENALTGFTKGLDAIIAATLKKFADAQSQSEKIKRAVIFGEGQQGDSKKSFGDWLLGVARNDRNYLEKHYGSTFNQWSQKAAMGEAAGATGGYTVPPEFYTGILAIAAEDAILRNYGAWVQPMSSATFMMPYLDITTAQAAGITPFFGGVKMSWTAEAQTRTETEPAFKLFELKAWELSGYSVSSNVLLQDSAVGLEKLLMMLFGKAIAWYEDYAFLQGSGAGQPMGIKNSAARITVTRSAANAVAFADIAAMWANLLPASWGRCIWTFTPSVVPQLLQLKDGNNRAMFMTVESYPDTGGGGIHQRPNWSLLGRPAIPTEKLPKLSTEGDIMLIDPTLYVIGDRMSIEIAASEHVNFLANQMTWRVVERVDGRPWLEKPITLQDSTTQVSPFVTLSTI